MVKAVGAYHTVLGNGTPALPHGGRTFFHLIQPAGTFCLEHQLICHITSSVFTENVHQKQNAEKACIQAASIFLNHITEMIHHFLPGLFRYQIVFQGDHINSLEIRIQRTVFVDIFFYKCFPDVLI